MKRGAAEKRLRWAFGIALALHGLALAGAATLPAASAKSADLDQIQVFDQSAPLVAAPVDLVEWTEPSQPPPGVQIARPLVRPSPPEPAAQPQASRRPIEATATRAESKPSTRRTEAHIARPAVPAPSPIESARAGGGGGGGSPANIGAVSPQGDLPSVPGGGTPVGSPPGAGDGSGSGTGTGTGSGSGSGSGGGSGSGAGSGQGSGVGPGAGSEPAPGTENSGPKRPSKRADRKQPVVISKGRPLTYPPSAVEDGVEGTVTLEVDVTEAGAVAEVVVTGRSGDSRLDDAAKRWVQGWRYEPAVQDGKPRWVRTHATVRFKLE